jgi:hypothetical protein
MIDQTYRYLDTEADRQRLLADIREVRHTVVQMIEHVPEDQWYEPRYHGWSLAGMLGHLQFMDSANLLLIKAGLLGISIPIPPQTLNSFNNFLSRVFQKRVVKTSIQGIQRREAPLEEFIMNLPIDKFTRQVFYPPMGKNLTVEQAVQVLFLHHWQEHLQTMQEVEGIQPRDSSLN